VIRESSVSAETVPAARRRFMGRISRVLHEYVNGGYARRLS
jgi:hypothetical protein